ncbi:MAG: hypothetical protein HOL48_09270 [Porticoccaceae bacterium]|jgi:hypothetical protein|nr:hypothetical protein [Porticoccaceae bacterium]
MKPVLRSTAFLMAFFFSHLSSAATLAELKLIAPLEEERGWCVDLFAHLTGGLPIGGFQGHNCFSYFNETPTEDQGFDAEMFLQEGVIRLAYFDICMTVHEPRAGSFVASEPCTGEDVQKFDIQESGEIVSVSSPSLCLTAGTRLVTGGGGDPIHLIRGLTFEECDAAIAERQQWELRYQWEGPEEATLPRPYN